MPVGVPGPELWDVPKSINFKLRTNCISAATQAVYTWYDFSRPIVEVRVVYLDITPSGSYTGAPFPWHTGLEMTLDTTDPEPGVYTLTTDALNFMYGFAIMNDVGGVIYDIGSSSTDQGCIASGAGNCRLESPLAGAACAERSFYGDYYNRQLRSFSQNEEYVFGSCDSTC